MRQQTDQAVIDITSFSKQLVILLRPVISLLLSQSAQRRQCTKTGWYTRRWYTHVMLNFIVLTKTRNITVRLKLTYTCSLFSTL